MSKVLRELLRGAASIAPGYPQREYVRPIRGGRHQDLNAMREDIRILGNDMKKAAKRDGFKS